jgi:hypothetical protein
MRNDDRAPRTIFSAEQRRHRLSGKGVARSSLKDGESMRAPELRRSER